jgi:hypothetical protein
VVKHFRPYLLKSRTKVIVLYPAVRNLLVQKELGEKRAHWMTSLQEYDLEIKPTQIVRGQGLCKLVVDSVNPPDNEPVLPDETLSDETQIFCTQTMPNSWYNDIKFYLIHGTTPQHLDPKRRRELRLKYAPFQLINDVLFRKNFLMVYCYAA